MSAPLYIVSRMLTEEHRQAACRVAGVGEALRALRLEAGLTQAVLAQKLGTTQSAVARVESGRSAASLRWVERAAAALGCDLGLVFVRGGS